MKANLIFDLDDVFEFKAHLAATKSMELANFIFHLKEHLRIEIKEGNARKVRAYKEILKYVNEELDAKDLNIEELVY